MVRPVVSTHHGKPVEVLGKLISAGGKSGAQALQPAQRRKTGPQDHRIPRD
jgi:hypothetical protein